MAKKRTDSKAQPGRYAYDGLDRVMHEKARLGILASLAAQPEGLVFSELKTLVALTDGNLSRHLGILQEAGLIEMQKGFQNNRPQTLCRLSREGRERFMAYLGELDQVLRDAQALRETAPEGRELREGWAQG